MVEAGTIFGSGSLLFLSGPHMPMWTPVTYDEQMGCVFGQTKSAGTKFFAPGPENASVFVLK